MPEPGSLQHAFDAWEEITRSLDEAVKILAGFDFDGTLTPIVKDPDLASIPQDIRSTLYQISSFEDIIVSVLSGRSLQDLQSRISLEHIVLAGDHGLKIRRSDGREYQAEAALERGELHSLIERVGEMTSSLPGILLEPKEFSLTVHYRGAPSGTNVKLLAILKEIVAETSFQLQTGRMCWELNPVVDWNKGRAFQWIRRHYFGETPHTFQIYIGDDRTDEDVFQLLKAKDCSVLVASPEKMGPTHARFRLDSQDEVGAFLEKLTHNLSERSSRQPG